jgi:hypothetical protein
MNWLRASENLCKPLIRILELIRDWRTTRVKNTLLNDRIQLGNDRLKQKLIAEQLANLERAKVSQEARKDFAKRAVTPDPAPVRLIGGPAR